METIDAMALDAELARISRERAQAELAIVRDIVATHAEGSVSLSLSHYFTQADADELVREVLSYDFSEKSEK